MSDKEKPLPLAVVGLGGWGKNVLRSFCQIPACRVAMICDVQEKLLQQATIPGVRAVTAYEEVVRSTEIEAVALSSPSPLHAPMAKAALQAGKHVYVEKPMTLQTAQAEELVHLAEEKKRTLMVGHLLKYHPAVEFLKKLIQSGELGELHYLYCQRLNLGVVRKEENAFWSLAPHDISVAIHLFEAEPESVTVVGSCYLQPQVEDVVFANLLFSDGRMAQIHVSWLDPHKERKIVVVGSRKMAVFDDMEASEKIRIYDKGVDIKRNAVDRIEAISVRHGEICLPWLPSQEPLVREAQHFVDCVHTGNTPLSDGRDGLRVVRVLEAGTESLKRRGVPVSLGSPVRMIL